MPRRTFDEHGSGDFPLDFEDESFEYAREMREREESWRRKLPLLSEMLRIARGSYDADLGLWTLVIPSLHVRGLGEDGPDSQDGPEGAVNDFINHCMAFLSSEEHLDEMRAHVERVASQIDHARSIEEKKQELPRSWYMKVSPELHDGLVEIAESGAMSLTALCNRLLTEGIQKIERMSLHGELGALSAYFSAAAKELEFGNTDARRWKQQAPAQLQARVLVFAKENGMSVQGLCRTILANERKNMGQERRIVPLVPVE